jgi:c-di-GMP-binding flagellar brake protein YcgR
MLFERENQVPSSAQDRRTMRRFDMRLPAIVKLTGDGFHEVLTETQNVSAGGVYFYVDRKVSPGSKVEITLTLPAHVTLADAVRVRFTARIVRVDSTLPASRVGVAALIENYEFLRSPQTSEYLDSLELDWTKAGAKARI